MAIITYAEFAGRKGSYFGSRKFIFIIISPIMSIHFEDCNKSLVLSKHLSALKWDVIIRILIYFLERENALNVNI